MPFYERTVEPRRLCRLTVEKDGSALFASLDEVSSRAHSLILRQLSDVSRHACDIFRGVELQAALVFQRSSRIQQRLDCLHTAVSQLNPKHVQILCCLTISSLPYYEVIDTAGTAVYGLSRGSRLEFESDNYKNMYIAIRMEVCKSLLGSETLEFMVS
ncbi:NHS-like protein 1 isoform X4 [Silurus meridionalis]|uniref:Uncharacterized protein n=1 Tax=Silurus meridionalis TaxID=175797 RepID=A0A8T0AI72_SILME|nr:hypothetical protein HF521_012180 [Silurus meridionalis]KAI5090666.1 NHS-like protein 1 isoform X4 [Silurus meridionalis]